MRLNLPHLLRGLVFLLVSIVSLRGSPLTFSFQVDPSDRDPFAREIWGEVQTPNGRVLRLPAYFDDANRFTVRVRREEPGIYRLRRVWEGNDRAISSDSLRIAGLASDRLEHTPENPASPPAVQRDPERPRRFQLNSGTPFVPIGSNLPWPSRGRIDYYQRGIPAFGAVGLNWMRIWMAHWSGLNLDWLPPRMGPSPAPGKIDARVAKDWDELVAQAERAGVYLQIVLQHHGQYSTTVNPNWGENPWSLTHPEGFLACPAEFFTSPRARELTKRKYRYIVARYGWSPAVMAWELFNEVHWVDALKIDRDTDAVTRWHAEMADYLRSVDAYQHLVTTSTDDVRSPFYDRMDFIQPHLYPSNILAAIRTYHGQFDEIDRPIFYGEFGDDHQPLTEAEKKANHAIVPPVWASLMGAGELPAQVWLGWNLLDNGRIAELGAVASFLRATKFAERAGLAPFSPVVESTRDRVPLLVTPSHVWQPRPEAEVSVPLDGTQPMELADIPRILGRHDDPENIPARTTFRVTYPGPARVVARFANGHDRGAQVSVLLNGHPVGGHTWPARPPTATNAKRPAEIAFAVPAGEQRITLENTGSRPVEFHHLDLGVPTATLAAIGKRSGDFVAVWLWHRSEIFAVRAPMPVTGTIVIADVPAGSWRTTWWDTLEGRPRAPSVVQHPGGALRVQTPKISRHAAVVLERQP